MIKEKLMTALKKAAELYNGGKDANSSVATAADEFDFNEKQAERLTEMFNTTLALGKQKDSSDPTGKCELAEKTAVAKLMLDMTGTEKAASCAVPDYSFYGSNPARTNPAIEARTSGRQAMCKAASSDEEAVPPELNISQRSLYKVIEGKIDLLKSAANAADDVVRNLRLDIEDKAVKIAKAIESPHAVADIADMFKAACEHPAVVSMVSEYSTKVAESNGGRYSSMSVFDTSAVDDMLKIASDVDVSLKAIGEYERKRDFYATKAAEAKREMLGAVGLAMREDAKVPLSDMLVGIRKSAGSRAHHVSEGTTSGDDDSTDGFFDKSAWREDVLKMAEELEKDASVTTAFTLPVPALSDAMSAVSGKGGLDNERSLLLNARRAMILSELLTDDPIIRDADPNQVMETYKVMVMTSPRVSLDKAQVRSFLRSAVNSVSVSPADAKVISDVDKGVALANIERLTHLDSSIKDSNV